MSQLHDACERGDLLAVTSLIKHSKHDLNIRNSRGNTPLHLACKGKSLHIIRFLLEMRCSTKIPNSRGEFARQIPLNGDGDCLLHIACQWGDVSIIKYLITDERCNPSVQSSLSENTPLHIAAKYGCNDTIVELLSCKECNPNSQNKEGDTPLHFAVKQSKTVAISRLLTHLECNPNVKNKEGDTPLHIAVRDNITPVMSQLLTDEECDPNAQNKEGDTPLHFAVKYGQGDTMLQLLSCEGCNPNAQNKEGDTPVHIAVRQNKSAATQQLLAHHRCDTNVKNREGDTPLHIACNKNFLDIVVLLLEMRCSTKIRNKKGESPLHIACYKKSIDIIKLLLKKRCSTNIPNKKSETAQDIPLNEDGDCLLHMACQWGDVDIIKYLITDERCNPNVQCSTSENTPIHIAAKYGQNSAIVQLLSYKLCNPNAQNKEGDSPLHVACYRKSLNTIKLLLLKKCSTNIPNKKGETAQDIPLNEDGDCLLHMACQWGDVDIIKYLITDERCNPNVQSFLSENTPLHSAAKYGQNSAIVELLSYKLCNSNAQNKYGDSPLHVACYRKSIDTIKLFLQSKCSTNIPNKKGETAQDIPLNEDGDCLLHLACLWGDVDIVKYLITDERCNPNVQSFLSEDTPLHIAARYGQNSAIVQLLSYKQCNPNAQNKGGDSPLHVACYRKSIDTTKLLLLKKCSTNIPNKKGETAQDIPLNVNGDCLLHLACQWGDVDIVKYLITDERCDLNIVNSHLNTPMHISCYQRSLRIIRLLIGLYENRCSTSIPNKKGETAQDIPLNEDGDCLLHMACQWDVGIVRYLITDERCNPNVQSCLSENTPLHIVCKYGHNDTIVQLLSCKECNPNAQNKEGDTPLHFAVKQSKTVAISRLLTHLECNPNVKNKEGDTPLHIAVRDNRTPVMSQLLTSEQCDPNAQNKEGDTPLHIAIRDNITPAISQLLSNKECDPNVQNHFLTPLLTAIKHNNHTAANALLQHSKCDPTLCDQHGNTPLHLACVGGETQPEMVEVAKNLLTSVNPSCVNNAGQTPIELTTNYQLIQAISHFVKCVRKQSVQTYINMFIVGNPETGKSTLVKAICKEATSILWKIVPKQIRKVKNVPLHTAGIIPTTFRSKIFGNTVLYDLAGQVEYYTSHAAVIQSTVISTPPAFIVVVNLSESEEKISQTLRYWWSFIDNHASRSSAPPQVILVGSHADVVKFTGKSVKEKMTQMSALLNKLPASFYFAGEVALDCRDPASRKLRHFCSLVNQSCTVLREKADVDLRCHVLYAFLLDRYEGKVACTVSDVAISLKENRELLPQNSTHLIPQLSTLSDKGLLFLVKGGESCGDWCIILQKQALLGEINGTIFAPKNFRQHKDLSWSTGVVPFSKLKNEFADYDPNMVTEFLIHLEFCFKIEDYQTLALLKDEAANIEDTSQDVTEEYYFFPALVSVDKPLQVWEQNDAMCCRCGWFYQCIQPNQFLTTQFLHVLILRLAFIFALKLDPGDCRQDALALRRKCSVWKHGIGWLNRVPIETVVEVGLQYQSVIVMMRCPTGKETECVQLRSEVIQNVIEAKDEHCKAVKMSESFIHPTDVKYPFTDNMENVKLYSVTEIARVEVKGAANALDHGGKNPVSVQDLLLYNTNTSTELLRELFSEKHSMDETVRSQVLEALNSKSEVNLLCDYQYVKSFSTL